MDQISSEGLTVDVDVQFMALERARLEHKVASAHLIPEQLSEKERALLEGNFEEYKRLTASENKN